MFFIGLGVDGQSGLFVKSFQLAAGLLHGTEFRSVPGGRNSE